MPKKPMSIKGSEKETVPWVEKYRPTRFEEIVLDPMNREIFTQFIVLWTSWNWKNDYSY